MILYSNMTDNLSRSIQENYDRLANEYARHLYHELEHKPFDREMLRRFAGDVGPRGEICDLACGPGQVARYLRDAGMNVFGLDLSPRMIEQARRLNPDVTFQEGDMMALNLADGSLAGIAAFYAIVNLPADALPAVFAEMARVLQPRGLLLLAFHVGDETIRPAELWSCPISMDFYLFPPTMIQLHLEAAGFVIEELLEREPYPPDVEYQSRRAYIFARKPA